jgi:hypothetical protein
MRAAIPHRVPFVSRICRRMLYNQVLRYTGSWRMPIHQYEWLSRNRKSVYSLLMANRAILVPIADEAGIIAIKIS